MSDFSQIKDLTEFLDFYADKFNQKGFIELDPVSIPHQYSRLQDIEIMGSCFRRFFLLNS